MNHLSYIGGAMAIVWGVAHIVATNPVVKSFGQISRDNQRILVMEWIAEGIALCFIGLLVILTFMFGEPDDVLTHLTLRLSAAALFIFAGLAVFTGARTSQLPFRICPFIEMGAGSLVLIGSYL